MPESTSTTHGAAHADASAPERRPEHAQLEVFAGEWKTEGRITAEDAGSSTQITSVDVYEWMTGGFFLVHRWDSQVGDTAVSGLEVIGFDAQHHSYRTAFFDSSGHSGVEHLTREGNTWTWLGFGVMGAKGHRCISTVSDDRRTIVARHERSADGVHWTPWMDVTLTRIT